MDLDDDSEVEQFSDDSARQLEAATKALQSALDEYVATVTQLRGRSVDFPTIFAANDVVRRAASTWDDAASDHTGTFPIAIEYEDEDEDDEDDDDEDLAIAAGAAVSVVSRHDFVVTDPNAVLAAAREAWSRTREEPADEADIPSTGHALYELIHDGGQEILHDLPGLVPTASITVFRQPAAPLDGARMDDADSEMEDGFPSLFAPDGEKLFSFGERWG